MKPRTITAAIPELVNIPTMGKLVKSTGNMPAELATCIAVHQIV